MTVWKYTIEIRYGLFHYGFTSSLTIYNSAIRYNNKLYKYSGNMEFAYNDQINIEFKDFTIDSPSFDSELVISSGSVSYFKHQIIIR